MRSLCGFGAFLSLVLAGAVANAAPILNVAQTFDDPHGWVIGVGPVGVGPIPVPTQSIGGITGDNDPFLSLIATGGNGPGSRLSAQNLTEWTGDYLAAGVNAIQMNVRNFGLVDLALRLLFVQFDAGGAPVSAAFSKSAIPVPGASGWLDVVFDVSPSALIPLTDPVFPVVNPATTLANVSELRIFHNPDPFFIVAQNPAVVASLGVDNITAAAIASPLPEPASALLVIAALAAGGAARRRHGWPF